METVIRRRENMVGVNMVLAESVKFKHGLYKSCGTECFEGIMLEPCLLQPCFHVAGKCPTSIAEICGDDESAQQLRRAISKSWLVKFPTPRRCPWGGSSIL